MGDWVDTWQPTGDEPIGTIDYDAFMAQLNDPDIQKRLTTAREILDAERYYWWDQVASGQCPRCFYTNCEHLPELD